MKLLGVDISSFRSIVDQHLEFKHRCMGLVGLNESGKSNVLCALRTLNNSYSIKPTDISKIKREYPRISFVFELTKEDCDKCLETLADWLKANTQVAIDGILQPSEQPLRRCKIIRSLGSDGKVLRTTEVELEPDIQPELMVAKDSEIKKATVVQLDETEVPLSEAIIIHSRSLKSALPTEIFTSLTKQSFVELLNTVLQERLSDLSPDVSYWEYNDKYLVPSETLYSDFINGGKPRDYSVPLYNIFFIAKALKITTDADLVERIKIWQADSSQRRTDADIVNEALESYIKSIWQDYDQELDVTLEQTNITVHIKDPASPNKNYYEMVERSQGFKTFVSFILTIAADVHSEYLDNVILVIDEPETHLHPSGVRFMRQELLKLAEKGSLVVFATHSIFMIFRTDLTQHVIVSKKHEKTKLQPVDRRNITQESVIYEAMGTSVDEFSIRMNNIMFEGETDLVLFNFYRQHCVSAGDAYHDADLLDGGGTDDIGRFFKDKVIPKESKWTLVLDNDAPANRLINQLQSTSGLNYSKQIRIAQYSNEVGKELEDILPLGIVRATFLKACDGTGVQIPSGHDLDHSRPISSQIAELKKRLNLQPEVDKELEKQFKTTLLDEIRQKLEAISTADASSEACCTGFKAEFPEYYSFLGQTLYSACKDAQSS